MDYENISFIFLYVCVTALGLGVKVSIFMSGVTVRGSYEPHMNNVTLLA